MRLKILIHDKIGNCIQEKVFDTTVLSITIYEVEEDSDFHKVAREKEKETKKQ